MPTRAIWKILGSIGLLLPVGLGLAVSAGAQSLAVTERNATLTPPGSARLIPVAGRNDAYVPSPEEASRSGWRDEPVYRAPPAENTNEPRPEPYRSQQTGPSSAPPSMPSRRQDDSFRAAPPAYSQPRQMERDEPYRDRGGSRESGGYRDSTVYSSRGGYGEPYRAPDPQDEDPAYGSSRGSGRGYDNGNDQSRNDPLPPDYYERRDDGTYSVTEIVDVGHRMFGSVTRGVASAIEYAFKRGGRPNGYIIGEDAGGALIAGVRYGEGTLYTKDAGQHKVYWQGPSIGYDAGAEGSRVMVLVYNLQDPVEIYNRFAGIAGSAYVVGGLGVTFQKHEHVSLAPIRAGVGFRLGANVGYLKYTRRPTWNPF